MCISKCTCSSEAQVPRADQGSLRGIPLFARTVELHELILISLYLMCISMLTYLVVHAQTSTSSCQVLFRIEHPLFAGAVCGAERRVFCRPGQRFTNVTSWGCGLAVGDSFAMLGACWRDAPAAQSLDTVERGVFERRVLVRPELVLLIPLGQRATGPQDQWRVV